MNKENSIEFKVYGRKALFSDPINRIGGEKFSYQIPTYEALKGIVESIYWKPTFVWVIDKVRVMNQIQTESSGIRPIEYAGGNTLSYYTYLRDVEYQIKAHFEWNENRKELAKDRNENKHFFMAKRMLERGGRRDIFLGTRECQGYVEPCSFGKGVGAYDQLEELSFGLMVHGLTYPDLAIREEEKGRITSRFWCPIMKKGVVEFIRPEECSIRRILSDMKEKEFNSNNFSGLEEFEELLNKEGVL
ncbi:type I-C CRISPR-associated protein Cas5c [Candidatus Galacturonibacter soehngenii]|uniref:pre-crRNA processing endonuclease n=1 Tax=Candidatus Galacturonatibacter soehngenii TaxID=2307010 RepID=A0A7V7UBL3_9FIRM|nr:type I-C CRISPR-associated protein Cas5c [Candidatus Galacturonibacter soehngenii]KAB1437880.1 type I-C CRISPR-associated protein Cas5 [Candidatus Galacturonibacter soehngenii]